LHRRAQDINRVVALPHLLPKTNPGNAGSVTGTRVATCLGSVEGEGEERGEAGAAITEEGFPGSERLSGQRGVPDTASTRPTKPVSSRWQSTGRVSMPGLLLIRAQAGEAHARHPACPPQPMSRASRGPKRVPWPRGGVPLGTPPYLTARNLPQHGCGSLHQVMPLVGHARWHAQYGVLPPPVAP